MMKRAALFSILGLSLAPTAWAGAIEDGRGAKVETAYARDPGEGGGAGGPAAMLEPNRDEAAHAGNPLWAIPLSTLTATRDRPLFSASRRPPAAPVEPAAPPLVQAPPPPPPAPPEQPSLTLLGTIVSPGAAIAILREGGTQSVTRLRKGEAASGWLLQSVEPRSIVVDKGEQSVTLALPEPLDATGQQPAPDQQPAPNPPPAQAKRSGD